MREELKWLIEKADVDDEHSLHWLALGLKRAGFPREMKRFKNLTGANAYYVGPDHDRTLEITLLDASGVPVHIPGESEAKVVTSPEGSCIQIDIPGTLGGS